MEWGKFGLVSQESWFIVSTIKDNIACIKDGTATEEIGVAAELASALFY